MTTIKITNADEVPIKKYGLNFEAGQSREVPIDIINTYSQMEQSLALQFISRRLSKMTRMMEDDKKRSERKENIVNVVIKDIPTTDPWLVRKYKERKRRKQFQKEWTKRNTEAKP